jgi:predicted O-linked N-acetylglucosamine transferase (SPINDLY family)
LAFSTGKASKDDIQQRLRKAFDRFIEVDDRTDLEIAQMMRYLEIDIAVDLNGHTSGARTSVFAMRPAPIQVNYIGYPGTLGADYMDYIIADRMVIPPEQQGDYAEQVVYLPHTFQVNDSTKVIAASQPDRKALGLPEDGFVYCCINNNYKITPDLFAVWMRLLKRVRGSVLWLLEGTPTVVDNLRREAEKQGVSGERLVFAKRLALPDYLAQYRLADLFLDTWYYNAGTTASDALWAGLPVLTCLGQSFAGRMAGSLLKAIGLPEMITGSHEEYEALALLLAQDRERLAALKAKLERNRLTYPLFDTAQFTKHLEVAYVAMWERYQAGLPPDTIIIEH